ncbi:hypothetical protein LMH87_011643 [Akanthomyces muscarius]|uniref:VOC domain-containing protein n=1 Tax=Akanthomyces muscarius TaxID=2231603 RepID=A0A9W8QB11_AKAMU|nr:hypothetical protein LMH87_011643 [Akanthomyces muscarius]KAJ4150916.1 hypothetical protein LMH87_011643 [Akanthomyces muscarius]
MKLRSTLLALSSLSTALSCATHLPRQNGTGSPAPPIDFGPDAPSDPATTGYFINHVSLNVQNLTASLAFYTEALGLRHIFTVRATPRLSIAYLGHARGGRNGTGYQTTQELLRDKNNAQGLVEMIWLDVPRRDIASPSKRTNGVGHIGVVVPDVDAAQARLEALGSVGILKRVGEDTPRSGPLAVSQGFSEGVYAQVPLEERRAMEAVLDENNRRFIYAQDPDGNILEIQPQD